MKNADLTISEVEFISDGVLFGSFATFKGEIDPVKILSDTVGECMQMGRQYMVFDGHQEDTLKVGSTNWMSRQLGVCEIDQKVRALLVTGLSKAANRIQKPGVCLQSWSR